MTDTIAAGTVFIVTSLFTEVKKGGLIVHLVYSRILWPYDWIRVDGSQRHRTGVRAESFYHMDREVKLIGVGPVKGV
jgi:hypothetical protein